MAPRIGGPRTSRKGISVANVHVNKPRTPADVNAGSVVTFAAKSTAYRLAQPNL